MTVELDKIFNAQVKHDANGITATRTALIRDIEGQPERRARAALDAPGMPRYGERHPVFTSLRVADISLTALDARSWSAVITYRELRPEELAHALPPGSVVDVTWFSASVTVTRQYDADGNRLFHWYSGFPTTLEVRGGNVYERRFNTRAVAAKGESAEVQIPSIGVRVLLTESSNPRGRLGFVGSVNSGYWSGNPPYTWLFLGPSIGRQERGRWLNTYELLYRVDGWQLESVIEFNNAPPSDAVLGNGIARFNVYAAKNFGGLGFTV